MRTKTHPWNHLLSGDLGMFAATFPKTAERIRDAIYSAIEQDQHAALRAEVERLQSDAKRYRWFRAGLESNHADAYEIAEFAYRGGLDAAIDAAMQGDA